MAAELWPKRVQLLKEAFPAVKHLGMVFSPTFENAVSQAKAISAVAASLGLQVTPMELKDGSDTGSAFARAASLGVQACVVTWDAVTNRLRQEIAGHLTRLKVPAMFATAQYVESGGLMSYSASITDNFRSAATYADKILKGTPAGELPIEQPTRFELVVNLQTARTIGAALPRSFLLRVDRLVE
jgi:putative ABC transport system substrate-binding protein